jgi:hypothetical protein
MCGQEVVDAVMPHLTDAIGGSALMLSVVAFLGRRILSDYDSRIRAVESKDEEILKLLHLLDLKMTRIEAKVETRK